MTSVIQFSIQLPGNRIIVVGGDTPDKFEENFRRLLGEQPLDQVIADVVNALTPAPQAPPQAAPQGPPDFVPQQYANQMQPPSQWQSQAPMDVPPQEYCNHGPKKWVPPGTSQRTGKPYAGFWACEGPQGQKCPSPRRS